MSKPGKRRKPPRRAVGRLAGGITAAVLLAGGTAAVAVAATTQHHAPQPTRAQAGTIGPAGTAAPSASASPTDSTDAADQWAKAQPQDSQSLVLARSQPTSIDIPAIGVHSSLLALGLNSDGTIQVPPLYAKPSEAAWYKYSVTPGQAGTSVIEGHIDTYQGPSVFYRLGALRPGNEVDVTLADGMVAVFRVTGVRQYSKTAFPTGAFYGDTAYPSLHLVTCGGSFDSATRQYLSSTVVYAALISAHHAH
jgi:sortase (surface protein transpeptidase)